MNFSIVLIFKIKNRKSVSSAKFNIEKFLYKSYFIMLFFKCENVLLSLKARYKV